MKQKTDIHEYEYTFISDILELEMQNKHDFAGILTPWCCLVVLAHENGHHNAGKYVLFMDQVLKIRKMIMFF